jgi:hypothetical protein
MTRPSQEAADPAGGSLPTGRHGAAPPAHPRFNVVQIESMVSVRVAKSRDQGAMLQISDLVTPVRDVVGIARGGLHQPVAHPI